MSQQNVFFFWKEIILTGCVITYITIKCVFFWKEICDQDVKFNFLPLNRATRHLKGDGRQTGAGDGAGGVSRTQTPTSIGQTTRID